MDIFLWAVSFQILLYIYFEVTTLINLFLWNDVSKYSYNAYHKAPLEIVSSVFLLNMASTRS